MTFNSPKVRLFCDFIMTENVCIITNQGFGLKLWLISWKNPNNKRKKEMKKTNFLLILICLFFVRSAYAASDFYVIPVDSKNSTSGSIIQSIQRGSHEAGGTDHYFDVTINSVDTSKSIILVSGAFKGAARTVSATGDFINSTTIRVYYSCEYTSMKIFHWQVVEFKWWTSERNSNGWLKRDFPKKS